LSPDKVRQSVSDSIGDSVAKVTTNGSLNVLLSLGLGNKLLHEDVVHQFWSKELEDWPDLIRCRKNDVTFPSTNSLNDLSYAFLTIFSLFAKGIVKTLLQQSLYDLLNGVISPFSRS
jgi:hypothetical protein